MGLAGRAAAKCVGIAVNNIKFVDIFNPYRSDKKKGV